jgi:hypothetical protein
MSSRFVRSSFHPLLAAAVLATGLGGVAAAVGASAGEPAQAAAKPAAGGKFIGAAKCKNCHSSKESGDQFGHWKQQKHAKAFETLATPEAKKAGADKGVAEPQKAAECLKCHETAAAEADDRLMKGFDRTAGVQCESCHGPGEKHMKARMAAAAAEEGAKPGPQEIPKDELSIHPDQATCVGCHNKESPSYKPFCFKKRAAEMVHLDPRRARPADYLANLKCDCDECKAGKGN